MELKSRIRGKDNRSVRFPFMLRGSFQAAGIISGKLYELPERLPLPRTISHFTFHTTAATMNRILVVWVFLFFCSILEPK